MNKAVIKYNNIVCATGSFNGSTSTIQEDIVSMLALKHKPSKRRTSNDDDLHDKKFVKREPPPFVTHYKSSEGVKYVVGSKLTHNDTTFYFCDCPLHCNKLKWHTHHPDQCRLRKRWLKDNDSAPPSTTTTALANLAEEHNDNDDTIPQPIDNSSPSSPNSSHSDVQALLASAINLATYNEVVRDLICDALNAYTDA